MGNLILNSLEIHNFRGFEHLTIERLGRVNLIVGSNNIGKSSLLEALRIYAQRGSPDLIWSILRSRDESKLSSPTLTGEAENQLSALRYLFYGRKDVREDNTPISIGPINASLFDMVTIKVGWYKIGDVNGSIQVNPREIVEYNFAENLVPRLVLQSRGRQANYPLSGMPGIAWGKQIEHVFINSGGLGNDELSKLWDNISLTGLDREVLDSLKLVAPGVEGLNFRDDYTSSSSGERERIAIVKIAGINEPLPLRSLGDGMQHMLGIALVLANAKDGMALIDEIENGFHYSVLQELWQLIFRLAHQLNVQVFATTHSWECIEGFQKAAKADTQEEGVLIRLSLKGDDVISTIFDERKLAIATREQIEVR